jgi:hypothetical protein
VGACLRRGRRIPGSRSWSARTRCRSLSRLAGGARGPSPSRRRRGPCSAQRLTGQGTKSERILAERTRRARSFRGPCRVRSAGHTLGRLRKRAAGVDRISWPRGLERKLHQPHGRRSRGHESGQMFDTDASAMVGAWRERVAPPREGIRVARPGNRVAIRDQVVTSGKCPSDVGCSGDDWADADDAGGAASRQPLQIGRTTNRLQDGCHP